MMRLAPFLLLAAAVFVAPAQAQEQIEVNLLGGGVLPTQDTGFSERFEPSGSVLLNFGFPLNDGPLTAGLEIGVDLFTRDIDQAVRLIEAEDPSLRVIRLEGGDATVFSAGVFGRFAFGDPFASHPYLGLTATVSNLSTKNVIVQFDGEFPQGLAGIGRTDVGGRIFGGFAWGVSETTHLLVEPSYSIAFGSTLRGYAGLRVGLRYAP